MPHIEIGEGTFRRLQALARPLVDTAGSVIDRLIDSYEAANSSTPGLAVTNASNDLARAFDPANPPTLTFTKLRKATLGNKAIERPSWAELIRTSLEIGLTRLGFEELRASTDANIVKGQRAGDGYSYVPNLDISLQGEDAQDCWRIAFGLARKLTSPIDVVFEWRDKDGAAFPGQVGSMRWSPNRATR